MTTLDHPTKPVTERAKEPAKRWCTAWLCKPTLRSSVLPGVYLSDESWPSAELADEAAGAEMVTWPAGWGYGIEYLGPEPEPAP